MARAILICLQILLLVNALLAQTCSRESCLPESCKRCSSCEVNGSV